MKKVSPGAWRSCVEGEALLTAVMEPVQMIEFEPPWSTEMTKETKQAVKSLVELPHIRQTWKNK